PAAEGFDAFIFEVEALPLDPGRWPVFTEDFAKCASPFAGRHPCERTFDGGLHHIAPLTRRGFQGLERSPHPSFIASDARLLERPERLFGTAIVGLEDAAIVATQ